jgi:DNA-binding NarL/FixJ family response regulator
VLLRGRKPLRRALDLGAICFVGKATDPHDVAGAVHMLLLDSIHIRGEMANGAPQNGHRPETSAALRELTQRECEIIRLAAEGRSNAEIAATLVVTGQTVKFHLSNV